MLHGLLVCRALCVLQLAAQLGLPGRARTGLGGRLACRVCAERAGVMAALSSLGN